MKKIVIIGAGITGLSAGILAQQNGFASEIHEMHAIPGGLCTAWKRSGYVFDGCIRYVYGSAEGKFCSAVMRKAGVVGDAPFIHHAESIRVETSFGQAVIFHCDLDRLEKHLLEISPGDEKAIRGLVRAARALNRANIPAAGVTSPSELWQMMRAMPRFLPAAMKYGRVSLSKFSSSFRSPALREAFCRYYGYAELDDLPALFLLIDMAQHHARNAGWPAGGSLAFAEDMAKRYLSLGGKMHYRSQVEKILVTDGRACGIRLADGSEAGADYVIAASDVRTVLESMLGGAYTPPEYKAAFSGEKAVTPLVMVSLGVDMDLSAYPHSAVFRLREPVSIAGRTYDYLPFKHYCYDPGMAPQGKSSVVVIYETSFGEWERLAEDGTRYREEKENTAKQVIDRLEDRFPGFAGKLEAVDVATPLTWRRYTGNFEGSPQGWQTAVGRIGSFPATLPGLKNFHMAGQWVQRGGGLPGGAISAHNTIRAICKSEGKRFR